MTQPAATCFTCWREALPAEDQTPRSDSGTKKGHNPDRVIRMRCNSGHEFTTPLVAALEHGVFLDRARLRNYTPPAPIQTVQVAVSDALHDAVEERTAAPPSALREWRMRELQGVSRQLQGELSKPERSELLQRWADLTLLLNAEVPA